MTQPPLATNRSAATPPPAGPAAPDLRAVAAFEAALQAEALPLGKLLAWAEQHDDKVVRKYADQARTALAELRERHQADAELTAIDAETAELQKRLSELRGRRAELQPKKGKRPATAADRDHDPATVRAWAIEQGIEVAPLGRVPRDVVDQWLAAQGDTA